MEGCEVGFLKEFLYKTLHDNMNTHWWFTSKRAIVLDLIDRYASCQKVPSFLDVGCGGGLMLESLGRRGHVVGIDTSETAVKLSQGVSGADVVLGGLPFDIPASLGKFDVITALDVLEHIEDDRSSIKILSGLLEEGGVLVLTVPANESLWSDHDTLHGHRRRYSMGSLKELLAETDLKVEKISYFNSFLLPPIIAARRLFKGVQGISPPKEPLNFILKKIFSSEKFFLRHIDFPAGVSLLAVCRKTPPSA